MLFGETVAVYCENHTEHTDTLCGQNVDRLMLFGETVAVYCENCTGHTDTLCGQNAEFYCVKARGTYSNHWALKE
jgi:hypothetical protein